MGYFEWLAAGLWGGRQNPSSRREKVRYSSGVPSLAVMRRDALRSILVGQERKDGLVMPLALSHCPLHTSKLTPLTFFGEAFSRSEALVSCHLPC